MANKTKHKVTAAVTQDIYDRAKELPKVAKVDSNGNFVYEKRPTPGYKLKQEHLKPGLKLNPNQTYMANHLVYMNHAVIMLEKFKEGGEPAVQKYVDWVKAIHKATVDAGKDKRNWFEKLIEKILKHF